MTHVARIRCCEQEGEGDTMPASREQEQKRSGHAAAYLQGGVSFRAGCAGAGDDLVAWGLELLLGKSGALV